MIDNTRVAEEGKFIKCGVNTKPLYPKPIFNHPAGSINHKCLEDKILSEALIDLVELLKNMK